VYTPSRFLIYSAAVFIALVAIPNIFYFRKHARLGVRLSPWAMLVGASQTVGIDQQAPWARPIAVGGQLLLLVLLWIWFVEWRRSRTESAAVDL